MQLTSIVQSFQIVGRQSKSKKLVSLIDLSDLICLIESIYTSFYLPISLAPTPTIHDRSKAWQSLNLAAFTNLISILSVARPHVDWLLHVFRAGGGVDAYTRLEVRDLMPLGRFKGVPNASVLLISSLDCNLLSHIWKNYLIRNLLGKLLFPSSKL